MITSESPIFSVHGELEKALVVDCVVQFVFNIFAACKDLKVLVFNKKTGGRYFIQSALIAHTNRYIRYTSVGAYQILNYSITINYSSLICCYEQIDRFCLGL